MARRWAASLCRATARDAKARTFSLVDLVKRHSAGGDLEVVDLLGVAHEAGVGQRIHREGGPRAEHGNGGSEAQHESAASE